MLKKRMRVSVDTGHWGTRAACGFMLAAAVLRLWHYLPGEPEPVIFWVHLCLPTAAAVFFLAGMLVKRGRYAVPASIAAVVLGVVFFIVKAASFAPWHRALCTLLYLAVLVLYTLTAAGVLPTKKLLYPLFGLPLAFHIVTDLLEQAQMPLPLWDWMTELSVLCIMAGLFCLTFGMKTEQ